MNAELRYHVVGRDSIEGRVVFDSAKQSAILSYLTWDVAYDMAERMSTRFPDDHYSVEVATALRS